MRSSLVEEHSRLLFGQTHRLALMAEIARAPDGRVNPTDLSLQLGLAQSAFQAPLRDLLGARLITREVGGRRKVYVRQPSQVWDWILDLEAQLLDEEEQQQRIHALRSS